MNGREEGVRGDFAAGSAAAPAEARRGRVGLRLSSPPLLEVGVQKTHHM